MDWQLVGGKVLELFKKLTTIPHCSGNSEQLQNFIVNWAKSRDYIVKVDKAGNILATHRSVQLNKKRIGKGTNRLNRNKIGDQPLTTPSFNKTLPIPSLALQAHYDMVCVGTAPKIELIQQNGWIGGKNSSIGADNGLGVAIMLTFMELFPKLEYLFTADEEIGLVGATNLDLKLQSPYLLNLDGADEQVYIGSAGGGTFKIDFPIKREKKRGSRATLSLTGLPGGHSGEDIHRPIPNPIKELLKMGLELVSIRGGERENSIPQWCKSQIYIPEGEEEIEVITSSFNQFLNSLPHGVVQFDTTYQIPSQSINLAIVEDGKITLSFRGNSPEELEEVETYIINHLEKFRPLGIQWKVEGRYPAWKPTISQLSQLLTEKVGISPKVIHAGLECGVLSKKFPNLQIASYGPKIENLHSTGERFFIPSLYRAVQLIGEVAMELGGNKKNNGNKDKR